MHNRTPEVIEVEVGTLRPAQDFVTDPTLVKAYIALFKGSIKIAVTRIDSSVIHSGFFRRNPDGSVDHVSNLKPAETAGIEAMIRSGSRPSLDVRWSPHAPAGGGFSCADDEQVLAAYRNLKISSVPCRVLRPKPQPASEAALWLERQGDLPRLAKTVPPKLQGVATYFGIRDVPWDDALPFLKQQCSGVMTRVVEFHRDSGHDLHYHQMLHAVARRHGRALASIMELLEKGRREHASAICRLAYEAFLNFYLDWLAPQLVGPRLQLISALRFSPSLEASAREDAWRALTNFPGLLENASEKARLSPLGSWFHDRVYPPLSLIVHQSYAGIELEADGFDADVEQSDGHFSDARLVRCLDMLTAALLMRIENEVGVSR